MSSRANRQNGYLTAVLGSLIDAGTLIVFGLRLGIAYAQTFMHHAELDELIPPILGGFVGWWMGSVRQETVVTFTVLSLMIPLV